MLYRAVRQSAVEPDVVLPVHKGEQSVLRMQRIPFLAKERIAHNRLRRFGVEDIENLYVRTPLEQIEPVAEYRNIVNVLERKRHPPDEYRFFVCACYIEVQFTPDAPFVVYRHIEYPLFDCNGTDNAAKNHFAKHLRVFGITHIDNSDPSALVFEQVVSLSDIGDAL
ncbi:hypothetical protein MNB_SV-10-1329 [hydrothermal vent metagenome]|uniref:Uncharacterized protein n=1 Tax=hydrothermal vent metagenome TaxID=652676 RepID=A0A1W1CIZ1_9ZZZZ